MTSFQQEVKAATAKSEAESLTNLIQSLIGKMAGDSTSTDAGRTLQLKLRGYQMADVSNHTLFHEKKVAMSEAIAAAGLPIKASNGAKYKPEELLEILEARCEALRTCGARDLATNLRAADELAGLKKVLATNNAPYICDQCDRIMAMTGLLYG